jgi:formylglycine-generating enzyme required for sulfatase activity
MKKHFGLPWFLVFIFLVSCQTQVTSVPPLIDPGIDSAAWITIPAGEFSSGQHDHETVVDYDYEIMITDVTNEQYAAFLNEAYANGSIGFEGLNPVGFYPGDEFHGYEHEEEISEGMYQLLALDDPNVRIILDRKYLSVAAFSNHPVTFVSWFGAHAYCQYYSWRLPTEIEWEKAARGSDDQRPFPWGETLAPEHANYYSSHDIFEKTFGKAGSTTPVGFYNGNTYGDFTTSDSPSPYGLYDMAGNVWQWTGDVYEDQHYRYMRGGSKDTYGYNLRIWTRNSAGPEYYSPAVGFRCARDQ